MIFYIAIAVITCMLAYLVKKPQLAGVHVARQEAVNKVSVAAIFVILFLVSALRDHVGNDYGKYIYNFNEVFYDAYVVTEMGYNFVVKAIYHMAGSMNYYLVFALFSFLTAWGFVRALYKESEWFFMSFFLYMMLGMYYISFSTMRYYFVLGFAIYVMQMMSRKKYIPACVATLVLSLFHKSILIVIPIYILATIKWKKWHLCVMAVLASTGLFLQDFYMTILLKLYPSYLNEEVLDTGTSIVAVLRCVAVIGLAILYYKPAIKDNVQNRFYLTLNYFALLLYLFGGFIPELSRICYYMMLSQLFLIPNIIMKIPDVKAKRLITGLVIVSCVGYFLMFLLNADKPGIMVLPYRTVLLP